MSFVNPSAPPVIIQTGGVTFTTKCRSVPPPPNAGQITGDGNGTDGGGDADTMTGGAKDGYGTVKVFPDATAPPCPPFYLDMNSPSNNTTRFNVSFGIGSHITYTLDTSSSAYHFYNTAGSVVNYQGSTTPSRSVRLDVYPAGGIWINTSRYAWNNHTGFLFSNNSLSTHELTAYIRPHTRLNTHENFAFRMQGRDEDDIKSCIEMVYPTASNPTDVLVNVNYESNNYIPYTHKVKQYPSSTTKLEPETWIGVKVVYIIADDKKSVWMGMYEDIDPIDSLGRPANKWKLRADVIFTGVAEYENTLPIWKVHKNQIRIEGFANVDFMYISDREIDKGPLKNPAHLKTAPGISWIYGAIPQFIHALFDGDAGSG